MSAQIKILGTNSTRFVYTIPCVNSFTQQTTAYFLFYIAEIQLPFDTLLEPQMRYIGDEHVPHMFEMMDVATTTTKHLAEVRTKHKSIFGRKSTNIEFKLGVQYFD